MNIIQRIRSRWRNAKLSWSQGGEDLIVELYCINHGLSVPYYLDLGAHHPHYLSNTYRSYHRGGRGVLVEPSRALYEDLLKARPRDKVVRAAVVPKSVKGGQVHLQMMTAATLNTISGREAQDMVRHGLYGEQKVVGTEAVAALTVSQLLEEHCERCPDLVSLDIEGLDLPVLRSWDFKRWRPRIFIIEIVRYRPDGKRMERVRGIDRLMKAAGYHLYADTYINAVYVDRDPFHSLVER